jgi:serine/threonine protein kinase
MARIFTITEGVENMGTLKTGGQGSVYKARRIGEIITAIKILPTPIHSETSEDKNFVSFQNEVQKLKRVNEDPNPNVVGIINSGITGSGNFPYIEMEFIEGPDLEELLKPPHEPIFTIQESLKVAIHLSNALAHCHKADVRHGDIKSNNVKFNTHTGNYILLDFGLSVMSDEQRRTSLRQAGAIEFMAPEQHDGQLLFESEVYSFGVILFELLCGTVPFPLTTNSESARNAVMVAHLEDAPPNLLSLREQHLPAGWSPEKKTQEMQVPEWLVSMTYKCLEKKPANRFTDGMQLHAFIVQNSMQASGKTDWGAARIVKLEQENERLSREKDRLQEAISRLQVKNPGDQPRATGGSRMKNLVIVLLAILVLAFGFNTIMRKSPAPAPQRKAVTLPANDYTSNAEERAQLQKAREILTDGRLEEARLAFRGLAIDEIPEAMYEYGNLTLLNDFDKTNCTEAFSFLRKAAARGFVPAKRTVGFLYAFAGDSLALRQKGYQGCAFVYDIPRGSKLLMEASLQGDSVASTLLSQLNTRFGAQ